MAHMRSMSDISCDMLCDTGYVGAEAMGYGDVGSGFDMGFGF